MAGVQQQFAHELMGLALRCETFESAAAHSAAARPAGKRAAGPLLMSVAVSASGKVHIPVRWDAAGGVLATWTPAPGAPALCVSKSFSASQDALAANRASWAFEHQGLHGCVAMQPDPEHAGEHRLVRVLVSAQHAAPAVPSHVHVQLTRVYRMAHERADAGVELPAVSVATAAPFFPQLYAALALGPSQYDEDHVLLAWGDDDALLMGSMGEALHACKVTLRQALGAPRLRACGAGDTIAIAYALWPRVLATGNAGTTYVSRRVRDTAQQLCKTLRPTPPAQDPADAVLAMFARSSEEMAGQLTQLLAAEGDAQTLPIDVSRELGLGQCSLQGVNAVLEAMDTAGAPLHVRAGGPPRVRALVRDACRLEIDQRRQRDHTAVVRYSQHRRGNLRTLTAARFDRSALNTTAFLREYGRVKSRGAWCAGGDPARLDEESQGVLEAGSVFCKAKVPFRYSVALPGTQTARGQVFVRANQSIDELRSAVVLDIQRARPGVPLALGALRAGGLTEKLLLLRGMTVQQAEAALVREEPAGKVVREGIYVVSNGREHNAAKHVCHTWWFARDGAGADPTLTKRLATLNAEVATHAVPPTSDRRICCVEWRHDDTLLCAKTGACYTLTQNHELCAPYCAEFPGVAAEWLSSRLQNAELQFLRPADGWEVSGVAAAPGPASVAAAPDVDASWPPAVPRTGTTRCLVAAMMAAAGPPDEGVGSCLPCAVLPFVARRALDVLFANARGNAAVHAQHCRRAALFLWQDCRVGSIALAVWGLLHLELAPQAGAAAPLCEAVDPSLAVLLFRYWDRGASEDVVILRDAGVNAAPIELLLTGIRKRSVSTTTTLVQIWRHENATFTVDSRLVPMTALAMCSALSTLTESRNKTAHGVTCVFNESKRLENVKKYAAPSAHERLLGFARFAQTDMHRYSPHRERAAHARATASELATWLLAVADRLRTTLPDAEAGRICEHFHLARSAEGLRSSAWRAEAGFVAEAPDAYWLARGWRASAPAGFWSAERIAAVNAQPVPAGSVCAAGRLCLSHGRGDTALCCDLHLAEPAVTQQSIAAAYAGLLGALRMHAAAAGGDVRAPQPPAGGAPACLQNASLLNYCASRQHHAPARGLGEVCAALAEAAGLFALNMYLYTGADPAREEYNAETPGAVPCPADMVLAAPGDHSAAHNVLLRADAQLRSFSLLEWDRAGADAARVRFVLASREAFLDAHGAEAWPPQADPAVRTPAPATAPRAAPAAPATRTDLSAQVWHARVQHAFTRRATDGALLLSAAAGSKDVAFYAALQHEPDARRCMGALTLPPDYAEPHAISAIAAEGGGCALHVVPGRARTARVAEHGAPARVEPLAFVSRHARASVPPALAGFARRGFAAGASVFLLRERPAQGILRMCRVLAVREVVEHPADCACMDLVDGRGSQRTACRFSPLIARIPPELLYRDHGLAAPQAPRARVPAPDLHALVCMRLNNAQGERLTRLYLRELCPAPLALPGGLEFSSARGGLLLRNDTASWHAPAAGAARDSQRHAGSTPAAPFELLAIAVLLCNGLPPLLEDDLLLVARDSLLQRLHEAQPLWNTSFLCAACNREITFSRADCSDPPEDGAVCLACMRARIMLPFADARPPPK